MAYCHSAFYFTIYSNPRAKAKKEGIQASDMHPSQDPPIGMYPLSPLLLQYPWNTSGLCAPPGFLCVAPFLRATSLSKSSRIRNHSR
mmetsp:Transcript_47741/g.101456  ORF Transcript_47741/g.101456 Transcript_47741/m.101456 type:complete len:87 (-) Transcript_47741:165-425(-)